MSVAAVLMLALLSFYTAEATISSDDRAVHVHFHLKPDDEGRGDERQTIQKEEKSTKDAFEQERFVLYGCLFTVCHTHERSTSKYF